MGNVKEQEYCRENKQSAAASSSSVSEDSGSISAKSPGPCSPAVSPIYRRTSGPMRRAKGGWTPHEDDILRKAVATYKGKSWKKIAEFFPDRSEVQCLHRWQKVLNPDLIKGPWTREEDEKIIELVGRYGAKKWSQISKELPGRIGKQCRERWHNHLNPDIKKEAWSLEEEMALMNAHRIHGNKWAEIAKVMPGRTDNAIKNHWNSSLRKKLDFYLATGELPPPVKTDPQNDANDGSEPAGGLNVFSNKGSDSTAQTSSGTTDMCRLEEDGTDQYDSCLAHPSLGTPTFCARDSSDFKGVAGSPSIHDIRCRNTLSELQFDNVRYTDTELGKDVGTPPQFGFSPHGSLYYEPPQVGSYIPLDAHTLNTYSLPREYDCSQGRSVKFHTPPCINGSGLCSHNPESILKIAAMSFPNTPAILRKRKAQAQIPSSSELVDEAHGDTGRQRLLSSDKPLVINILESGDPPEQSLCNSPTSQGNSTLNLRNLKAFNASPPYRLRSKRTAVLKSVEKQLEFEVDEDNFDGGTNSVDVPAKGNTPVDKDSLHVMKMGIT